MQVHVYKMIIEKVQIYLAMDIQSFLRNLNFITADMH
jgi:hypothetical protein